MMTRYNQSDMYALAYLVVAVISAVLTTRSWVGDRNDEGRRRLFILGWAVAIVYAAFALSLHPSLQSARIVYMAVGGLIPAITMWTVEHLFRQDEPDDQLWLRPILASSVICVPAIIVAHVIMSRAATHPQVPANVLYLFTFGTFILVLRRLYEGWRDARTRVERKRRGYLFTTIGIAVILTATEQLLRASMPEGALTGQGPMPPLSAIATGFSIFLLYHTVNYSRLLDLHEVFSIIARVIVYALLLVGMDAVALFGRDVPNMRELHFQLFFASLLFIAAYEPLREPIRWLSDRLINRRGQQLVTALSELHSILPRMIDIERLVDSILDGLSASGRCSVVSIYLWDSHRDAFVLMGARGHRKEAPLRVIASLPFTSGFGEGARYYARPFLARQATKDATRAKILSLMDTQQSDVVIPFMRQDVVIGWVMLRDVEWSDGYSAEEINRLVRMSDRAAVTLFNVRDFEALEEKHRLAAIGALSTGLAHEIRNPLAGVKGATQVLEQESLSPESKEMLQVIGDEVDRLDAVVTRFLDYARPFELHPKDEQPNALVTHVLTLLEAEGMPPEISLERELAGDIPNIRVDGPRLQQVLFNLLRNAVQAMPEGGAVTVKTRMIRGGWSGPFLEISVRDTGPGIEEEHLDTIFVPFFTTKTGGTGLGLPICQRIIEAHGGELDVRTEMGKGTVFLIRLPTYAKAVSTSP